MIVVSWNILNQNTADWPTRRQALRHILQARQPDILCVQEAHRDQIDFMLAFLPRHAVTGCGRDDGEHGGEHCAILFHRSLLSAPHHGTLWFSDTPDRPGVGWDGKFPRICSWIRLQTSARQPFFVFNTHFPLAPEAREKAAPLLLHRIADIAGALPVVLVGDFNCSPDSPPWRRIENAGFRPAERAALGSNVFSPTFPSTPKPLRCLDAMFLSPAVIAREFRLIAEAPAGVFPSDHLGLQADLSLQATPQAPPPSRK